VGAKVGVAVARGAAGVAVAAGRTARVGVDGERTALRQPASAAADTNDLEPYWIFDTRGGYKIERQIPLLPLSREVGQLAWLKKTLVAYRSVIGQPRQEELTEFLLSRLSPDELAAFTKACSIDLSPRPGSHQGPSP
jgi:hypothetical protein